MAEEQLDYGEDEFGSSQKMQYHGDGAIPALADDEIGGEDDEYDDLYNDVNVGEGFLQMQRSESQPSNQVKGNGNFHDQKVNIQEPRSEPIVSLPQDTTININTNTNTNTITPKEGNMSMSIDLLQKRPAPLPDTQIPFRGPPKPEPPVNEPPPMHNPNPNSGQQMVTRPVESQSRPPGENGATMLFVGELHWWTTDAELESVLTQYGRVKEIKFFDERASGKSKGYCQVEFLESSSAAACKEGMNGYLFNGRPCVVAFASPQTIKQMGANYANKNQGPVQSQEPARRPINEGGRGGGANFGRGNFGRGGGIGRGVNNNMRGGGRGGMGPKNNNAGGPGFYGGPGFAGPPGGFMHPGGFPGGGFDPNYMGRGGYGAMMPNFPGMMPSFPIAGVAPHVNPAFFNRGMMEGPQVWGDTGVGQWGGEEVGQRTRESSYGGEDGGSEYGYTENEKGGQSQRSKEREREWSGNSEKRHREEREYEKDYKYNKEDKDSYREKRHHDEEWDRGQSSTRSRSRAVPEEDHHRSRSRDADYGKRRRSMRD